MFILGFPRDGTSRGTSRDNLGRDVPLSLCPGTKKFPYPVVPLSRDKKVLPVPLSLCPGTRAGANVPGQTPLSRDVPGQNEFQNFQKKDQIFCFRTSFSCFRTSFSAVSRFVPRPVPDFTCPGPSRPGFYLSRPVPSHGKILSLSLCPGTMKELLSRCPFVPGQKSFACPAVPKSCTVPSRWKPYSTYYDKMPLL